MGRADGLKPGHPEDGDLPRARSLGVADLRSWAKKLIENKPFKLVAVALANAQQSGKVYRIALVSPANPLAWLTEAGPPYYRALFQELRQIGYVEGQNLIVERYSGGGQKDRYPPLIREVVLSHPDLIFTQTVTLVRLFKAATTTIPIVAYVSDPVTYGLVPNLARPGGNITGFVADAGLEIQGKLVEILQETTVRLTRLGFLGRNSGPDNKQLLATQEAAEKLGITLVIGTLDNFDEPNLRRVFSTFAEEHVDALLVNNDGENFANRDLIVKLVAESAIPTLYPDRIFVTSGGLISYGFDLPAIYRRAAGYIDKILKGTKPGELPMEQPTKLSS